MPRITAVILFLLLLAVPAEVRAQAADNDAEGRRLLAAGRYEAALPYFQRDLALAEKRYGPDDPTIAIEVNNLAEVNRLAGRLEQAEKLYRRAIALDEHAKPKNPVGLATSLNNLALVYRAQGLLDKAAALHARLALHARGRARPEPSRRGPQPEQSGGPLPAAGTAGPRPAAAGAGGGDRGQHAGATQSRYPADAPQPRCPRQGTAQPGRCGRGAGHQADGGRRVAGSARQDAATTGAGIGTGDDARPRSAAMRCNWRPFPRRRTLPTNGSDSCGAIRS